jgi:hypothetical protein
MKKLYLVLIPLIPALLLLLANTGGSPAGYTGSPLDGTNCTSCHAPGPATQVDGWISTNIPLIGYTPGDTYTITLAVEGQSAPKYGFLITSETVVAKAGSWTITDAGRTKLAGSSAVTHTSAGTAPQGTPNTWSFDWTAPASGTGEVTFYAAVNLANANGGNSGDMIYVSSLPVGEANIGLAEMDLSLQCRLYPNPAHSYIMVKAPLYANLQVFDNSGRLILESAIAGETEKLVIETLEPGIYHLRIGHQGRYTSMNFLKY